MKIFYSVTLVILAGVLLGAAVFGVAKNPFLEPSGGVFQPPHLPQNNVLTLPLNIFRNMYGSDINTADDRTPAFDFPRPASSLSLRNSSVPSYSPPAPEASVWVPVIVYHHISTVPINGSSATKSFYIEPEWFERHLIYLKEHGFTSIHFSEVAEYFKTGKPLPDRPVIINFDDGWHNMIDNAFPLLEKYDMTATVFPIVNLVGKKNRMSWEELKQLRDAGIEIGSHTLWHPYLTKSGKVVSEVADSKKILEEELSITVTTFAYPFGDYDASIEKIISDTGYTTARSFSTGDEISLENIFRIPVIRVYANVELSRWEKQLTPAPHTAPFPY